MKSMFALFVLLAVVCTVVVETAAEPCILCLIFLKGYNNGRQYGRRGRSVESQNEFSEMLVQASVSDVDDCAKSFICQLNTKAPQAMDLLESEIYPVFGNNGVIDVTKASVEFDLAALTGRLAGERQCATIYARCKTPYKTLLSVMENTLKPRPKAHFGNNI
jgi:hypothetical protein